MRIGLAPAGTRDAATAVRMAVLAERAGLDEVWLSEDYLERGAMAVAGGVAAVTERVAIGLGVINPWTRHVGLTAMECAALDELSGGRLIVGLGASNERWMQGMLGIPFERPVSTMLEYVEALRELLAGRHLARTVGGLSVDAELAFRPLRPDLPIVLGVKGRIALRRSATAADGLMLSVLASPSYVEWVREQFVPPSITAYTFFAVDADASAARDTLRARTARMLGMHGASPITEIAGIDPVVAQRFRDRLLTRADAADLVTDDLLGKVTIAGDEADCVEGVRRFAATGLDSLVVLDDGSSDPAEVVDRVARVTALAEV